MRDATLGVLLATLLSVPACEVSIDGMSWFGDTISGSGFSASEARDLPDFERIEVRGSVDVRCRIGAERQVKITGDDNLLPYVITEVNDGTLVVSMQSGSYSHRCDLVLDVVVPSLEAVSVSGSADVDVGGLACERFRATVSGSGSIQADGEVHTLEASVSGSGDLELDALRAADADVSISGSGDADVHVTDQLTASVSGSGDIRYRGSPKTRAHVSGSGSVTRR